MKRRLGATLAPELKNYKPKNIFNKKERVIFGELVPYGQDWRLGANEATEVTFYQAVEIGGTYLGAGTYTVTVSDVNGCTGTNEISIILR